MAKRVGERPKYFKVKNFDKYQHYKNRKPPWIKLYNDILDDYEFACLQDDSKMHLIAIFLLASRYHNKIRSDSSWIAKRINAKNKVDLDVLEEAGFIIYLDDSIMLASRKQSAIPETETEKEKEIEKDIYPNSHKSVKPKSDKTKVKVKRFKRPTIEECIEYFKEKKYTNAEYAAKRFYNYYESNGWKVGRNKMQRWHSSAANWNNTNERTVTSKRVYIQKDDLNKERRW